MARIDVAATIQETSDLLEQKDSVLSQISDNRYLLRASVRSGQASAEQASWIEETFPTQKTKTPEERIAEAEARVADLKSKGNGGKARTRATA
jgi:hypothetical protein